MTRSSRIVTSGHVSTFAYRIGSVDRALAYVGGYVVLPEVTAEFSLTQEDFAWLVAEVRAWLADLPDNPPPLREDPRDIYFEIGNKVGQRWACKWNCTYQNTADTMVKIGFRVQATASSATVVFETHPAARVAWTDFKHQNMLAQQMLHVIDTGARV